MDATGWHPGRGEDFYSFLVHLVFSFVLCMKFYLSTEDFMEKTVLRVLLV